MVNKHPEKTNLGGLWLMNPHVPRCTQTNLQGLEPIIQNGDRGTLYAGISPALPVAWRLDVPQSTEILTGNEGTVDSFFDVFRGTHILRQQRFYRRELLDGDSHPWNFGGPGITEGEIVHAVWYDSLKRRVNTEDDPPPTILSERDPHRYPFRGFCWSLYYGHRPDLLGLISENFWWLVAALEPSTEETGPPFIAMSIWHHDRPRADETPNFGGTSPSSDYNAPRFNPLGKNVFRRVNNDGTGIPDAESDRLTIEPFYG